MINSISKLPQIDNSIIVSLKFTEKEWYEKNENQLPKLELN